jgi:hypothetical protein
MRAESACIGSDFYTRSSTQVVLRDIRTTRSGCMNGAMAESPATGFVLVSDGEILRPDPPIASGSHRFTPFSFGEEFLGALDPGRPGRLCRDLRSTNDSATPLVLGASR